jgi:putative endonuclease
VVSFGSSKRGVSATGPERRRNSQRAGSDPWQKLPTFRISRWTWPHFEESMRRHLDCLRRLMAEQKRFVYVLRNSDQNPKFYIGLSSDVHARLADHNMGRCPHTASRRPWQLHVVLEFRDEKLAIRFEHYLKSGSGRAFAKRHFEQ